MKYVGLSWETGVVKLATLSSQGEIEQLQTLPEPPPWIFQNKNIHLVTGLASDHLLRRELFLKLRKPSAILKALPFQLESLLPFDPSETIIYPTLHPSTEGTGVVVFATTRSKIDHHLQTVRVDPDQISCVPLALARFLRWRFPQEPCLRWIYGNTALALDHDKIVFSQTLDDPHRLHTYLDRKFPTYFQVHEPPHADYAIAIGLALEGLSQNSCQFRPSPQQKPKFSLILAPVALAALTACMGFTLLHLQQNKLENTIATYFTAPAGSLEEKIALWQKHLVKESKSPPLLPEAPPLSQVLAWLGQLEEPIEIVHFHYHLATIELDLKAQSPSAIEQLKKALEKEPTLVDTKEKITWTAHQNFYTIAFSLRKNVS